MIWERLRTTEFENLDKKTPVILNIAAIEQHGPQLPVNTDSTIGWNFCLGVDKVIPHDVLILPQVKVCCSRHHMDFIGTLTVSHETLFRYITECLESVYHHGFRNICILNSHGGNSAIAQVVVEHFGLEHKDINIAIITWWNICKDELSRLCESGYLGNGHAAEFEKSLMMHFDPESVADVPLDVQLPQFPMSWAESDLLHGAKISLIRSFRETSHRGIHGDVTHAHAEKGRQLYTVVVEKLVSIIKEIRDIERKY